MSNDASASDLRDSLPPSSVSFSVDALEQSEDDHSDLTGPCPDEDDDSREDNFGIKHAADPYYYHAADGANPLENTEQEQELFKLKLQLKRQQERLHLLSSKLSHCEAENEALKTEKAILVEELARATTASQELLIPNTVRQGWFSKSKGGGNNSNGCSGGGGSMQMLIDTNTQLMNDNARLQALADVTRKSLKLSIKDSRRGDEKNEQTIRGLQKENERLQKALATVMRLATTEHSKLLDSSRTSRTSRTRPLTPLGERTGKMSYLDALTDRGAEDPPVSMSLRSAPEVVLRNSLGSIPEQELPSNRRPGDLPLGASLHSAPEAVMRNSLGSIPEQELQAVGTGNDPVDVSEKEEVPNLRLISHVPIELVQRASYTRKAANAVLPKVDTEDYPRRRTDPGELLVDFGEASRTRRMPRHRPRYRQSMTADQRLSHSFTLGVATQPVKSGAKMDSPLNHSFKLGPTIRMPMSSGRETTEPVNSGNPIKVPVNSGRNVARELAGEADGAAGPPSDGDGGESHSRSYTDLLVELFGELAQKRRGAEQRLSRSLPQSLTDAKSERGGELLVDFDTARPKSRPRNGSRSPTKRHGIRTLRRSSSLL